jgi:hypothetical protein
MGFSDMLSASGFLFIRKPSNGRNKEKNHPTSVRAHRVSKVTGEIRDLVKYAKGH